jgi:hypothetical protein
MPASITFLPIYQGDLAMVPFAQSLNYIGPIGDVVSGLLKIPAPHEVAANRRKSDSLRPNLEYKTLTSDTKSAA